MEEEDNKQDSNEEEIKKSKLAKEFDSLGILGFFIFTRHATPIILRSYSDQLPPITDEASYQLSALISSMIQIAEKIVGGSLLRDVALHTSRMFIDYWDELIFVLVYDEPSYMDYRTSDILSLMKGSISLVKDSFQILITETPDFNINEIHVLIDTYRDKFKSLIESIDTVLYNSYFRMLESLNLKPTFSYQLSKNEPVSIESFFEKTN
ncbi:MAG: hypothetical protein ACXAC7_03720 [Candidatus Hodarchaeales archaeon]|jgi:hypothetical protein